MEIWSVSEIFDNLNPYRSNYYSFELGGIIQIKKLKIAIQMGKN